MPCSQQVIMGVYSVGLVFVGDDWHVCTFHIFFGKIMVQFNRKPLLLSVLFIIKKKKRN